MGFMVAGGFLNWLEWSGLRNGRVGYSALLIRKLSECVTVISEQSTCSLD